MTGLAFQNPRQLSRRLLACILALALALRLHGLWDVQRWSGDQAYFYSVMQSWFLDGQWPLLGVYRSLSGDFGLGPGFYYVIAPAMWLSHFSLVAGAVTQSVIGVAAIFLYWLWIRRTTGSELAALATAAAFAFSAAWVYHDRIFWNPNMLPVCVAALACLIEGLERRPVPALALLVMVLAILPHFHTTGWPIVLAALPASALALARGRGRLRESSRAARLGWGLALAAVLAALYVPPLLYELRPGPGNLRNYLKNSFPPSPPPASLARGVAEGTERLVSMAATNSFFHDIEPRPPGPAWLLAVASALVLVPVLGRAWLRRRGDPAPASTLFLTLLIFGNWLILVRGGAAIRDYFVSPVMGAPVLLMGWCAGRLLGSPSFSRARWAGTLVIAAGLSLTAAQLPKAWGIGLGRLSNNFDMRHSRQLCEYVIRDAGPARCAVMYLDAGNSPRFMLVMLRALGFEAANLRASLRLPLPRRNFGERLYLVVRGGLEPAPRFEGPTFKLPPPVPVADGWVYRIPAATLPPSVQSVFLRPESPKWVLQVGTK